MKFASWFRFTLYVFSCLLLLQLGCSSEVQVSIAGCEDCPNLCLREGNSNQGKCVSCLKDTDCQSGTSPTKKCTQDNKCICGSDKDCPEGKKCDGEGGCVDCFDDKDCEGKSSPYCIGKKCEGLCKPGDSKPCALAGKCNSKQTCTPVGRWGECVGGAGEPKADDTLCNGVDDDCDGSVDEDYPNIGQECSETVGPCNIKGKWTCKPDKAGVFCKGVGTPSEAKTEECNGKDDDCDGEIDNNLTAPPCEKQDGVCKGSVKTCGGEKGWLPCDDAVYSKHSSDYDKVFDGQNGATCDGKDNNCDGKTDESPAIKAESCPNPTPAGVGECQKGRTACKDQKAICVPTEPTKEICDGKDNDCDGKSDNGFDDLGKACKGGSGACEKTDVVVCKKDGSGTECAAKDKAPTDEVCNDEDDNCDGKIDEGLDGKLCKISTLKGVCADGEVRCTNGKETCLEVNKPSPEVADNLDNDCDGFVDEGLIQLYVEAKVGNRTIQASGIAINFKDEVFFSSVNTHVIYKVDPKTKAITEFAGTASTPGKVDDPDPLKARFNNPEQLSFDKTGTHLFVMDAVVGFVRRIDGSSAKFGAVTTYNSTKIPKAEQLTLDSKGNVFVQGRDEITKIDNQGTMTILPLIGGTAKVKLYGMTINSKDQIFYSLTKDECVSEANCSSCAGVRCNVLFGDVFSSKQVDLGGDCKKVCAPRFPNETYKHLYFHNEDVYAIYQEKQVFRLVKNGKYDPKLVAGKFNAQPQDGVKATESGFNNIAAIAFDKAGNLYIADAFAKTIRIVKAPLD